MTLNGRSAEEPKKNHVVLVQNRSCSKGTAQTFSKNEILSHAKATFRSEFGSIAKAFGSAASFYLRAVYETKTFMKLKTVETHKLSNPQLSNSTLSKLMQLTINLESCSPVGVCEMCTENACLQVITRMSGVD